MTTDEKVQFTKCECCGEEVAVIVMFGRNIVAPCSRKEQELATKQKAEEEQKRIDNIKTLRKQIPANFHAATFANDDKQDLESTKILRRFVDKFSEIQSKGLGLLMWGPVGTGKTFGAMQIANALVDQQISVACTTLTEVIQMAQDFKNADYLFSNLLKHKAIVIDDLGVHRSTTFADEQVYNFIDECNRRNKVLIITTNLTPSILQKASEDTVNLAYARIYSRILEKCYPIKVNTVRRRVCNQEFNRKVIASLLSG
ncbi:MAG: ATP-binding protein [Firmicutes bacterium]|nr:ATP-binding protein [Bacillota bacterium]